MVHYRLGLDSWSIMLRWCMLYPVVVPRLKKRTCARASSVSRFVWPTFADAHCTNSLY